MAIHSTPVSSSAPHMPAARALPSVNGFVTGLASVLREFLAAAFHPYHPERHYMRGPGPACAAKYGRTGK